jgi:RES domain-containing protein
VTVPAGAAFRGVAFCHVPADEPVRLDRLASTDGDNDRWNREGEPTVYLATDIGLAVAELARHLDVDAGDGPVRRRLLGLEVEVAGLLDLRDPDVRSAVGAPDAVEAFRDRDVSRSVADQARADAACLGLLVPSMAFLDEPERANLVLFVERHADGIEAVIRGQREAGLVEVRPESPPDSDTRARAQEESTG